MPRYQRTPKADRLSSEADPNNDNPTSEPLPHHKTCHLCVSDTAKGHYVQFTCGCVRGWECINADWRYALVLNRHERELPLCDCDKPYSTDESRPAIEPLFKNLFENYVTKLVTPPAEQFFCDESECNNFISSDHVYINFDSSSLVRNDWTNKTARCPACSGTTCMKCCRPVRYHDPAYAAICDEHVESFSEMAERKGWMKCRKADCGVWCSKDDGWCQSAECPICKTRFFGEDGRAAQGCSKG